MSRPKLKLFTLSAPTSIGHFHLVASTQGLRNLYWPNQKASCKSLQPASVALPETARLLKITAEQLADYLNGCKVRFTAPLDLTPLTPFARKVLKTLARLPYGQTTTYSQLAKSVGSPNAARAVGSCLARNPLPLIIPCHRVLTSTGSLGGFSAPEGPPLKQRLLALENVEL